MNTDKKLPNNSFFLFTVGINADGEITVGFCLNDNENKILGVQPGDKLIHLPDSMKYAAKV